MLWFSRCTLILGCFVFGLVSAPAVAQRAAFKKLVEAFIEQRDFSRVHYLLKAQRARSATLLQEEHLYDIGILQGACKVIENVSNAQEAKRHRESLAAHWDGLERLQLYKGRARMMFLQSVVGCERAAFINAMTDDTLTIPELEKAHALYEQEHSIHHAGTEKYRAMADWLLIKIQSKQLEQQREVTRKALVEMDEQGPRMFHYTTVLKKEAEHHLVERDLARVRAQLEFLYEECGK